MGKYIIFIAERKVGGKWKRLKDETGSLDFFLRREEWNALVWDLLCGDIDPNTGLTYYGFVPLGPCRGEPPDYPPRTYDAEWGHSWVLLQELIDFPWDMRDRSVRAFVDADNFRAFLDDRDYRCFPVVPPHLDTPVRYPRPDWSIVTQDQMMELLCTGQPSTNCYTEINFTRPYDISNYSRIVTDTIPELKKYGDPREIRIVFWFFC